MAESVNAGGSAEPDLAPIARALGYGGLLPFLGLAAAAFFDWQPLGIAPLPWLAAYAATILSFVGAVHWGVGFAARVLPARRTWLVASVVPALVAWVALALPARAGLWLFVAGFMGWYAWERATAWPHFPDGYRTLRTVRTLGVSLSLAAVAIVGGAAA